MFSPPMCLHSWSEQLVVEKKELYHVCDTKTISVSTGSFESLKNNLLAADALELFAHKFTSSAFPDQLGAISLVIPYVIFSDKITLCRMLACYTPAGYTGKEMHLHPKAAVAIAQVALKPSTEYEKVKSKSCVEGLVYSPTWLCGHSEELQACFSDRKLLPELVPVVEQLELATTMEIQRKLDEMLSSPTLQEESMDCKVCISCQPVYIKAYFYVSMHAAVWSAF